MIIIIKALFKREWTAFVHNPYAIIIVPLFMIFNGITFYTHLKNYVALTVPSLAGASTSGVNVMAHLLLPYFKGMHLFFLIALPLLTMRVFAEEKKLGTFQMLVSYPVHPMAILLGKYLGVLTIALAMLGYTMVFPGWVAWKGNLYVAHLGAYYLGYCLFIMTYIAFGVTVSMFTENQLVAAILTYVIIFSTNIIAFLAFITPEPFNRVFSNFLILKHLESFRNGLVYSGDVIASLCLCLLALTIGYKKLRSLYWS